MKKITLLCAALLLLAGCSAGPSAESTVPSIVPEAPSVQPAPSKVPMEESPASPTPTVSEPLPVETPPAVTEPILWNGSLETLTLGDFPTELATGEEIAKNEKPLYLLAQVEGQNIHLYGLPGGQGLILRVDDMWQYFDLSYLLSPRHVLPEVAYGDYDGDMQFEVALQIYTGSGTGVSVYDLHIIELNDDGVWTGHWFDPEDYGAILAAAVSSEYDAVQNLITVSAGESLAIVDLTAAGYPDLTAPVDAQFGRVVDFTCSGDSITASFGITVSATSIPPLGFYPLALSTGIVYTGSTFGLSELTLLPTA